MSLEETAYFILWIEEISSYVLTDWLPNAVSERLIPDR